MYCGLKREIEASNRRTLLGCAQSISDKSARSISALILSTGVRRHFLMKRRQSKHREIKLNWRKHSREIDGVIGGDSKNEGR